MRKTLISGFLFMVMMIVVLHNAIPHHHHEGVLMHNHDLHHDHQDSDDGEDHHPEKCIIQSIDFSVPRAQTAGKTLALDVPADNACILVNTDFSFDADFFICFLQTPCCGPPCKGVPLESPCRGPPSSSVVL